MTDLHPYDGRERRYRHTDDVPTAGLALVARLLGCATAPEGTQYDLSFYSGGIGVFDKLAIFCEADEDLWRQISTHLHLRTPAEALADPAWGPDFEEWLCSDPAAFLNDERRRFQDACLPTSVVYFREWSDVNCWTAVWGSSPGRLNYLGFQQG